MTAEVIGKSPLWSKVLSFGPGVVFLWLGLANLRWVDLAGGLLLIALLTPFVIRGGNEITEEFIRPFGWYVRKIPWARVQSFESHSSRPRNWGRVSVRVAGRRRLVRLAWTDSPDYGRLTAILAERSTRITT
jgi:hypothetical protein